MLLLNKTLTPTGKMAPLQVAEAYGDELHSMNENKQQAIWNGKWK
jgi:hypothetical protein